MEGSDTGQAGGLTEESDVTIGYVSLSPNSSLSSSGDFRRMMKPPNKKKYDDEIDSLVKQIRAKEAEQKSLGLRNADTVAVELRAIRAEKDATIAKRKKIDEDLKRLSQELTKKMNSLATTESNLHYKTEAKIDDAIRKLDWQLKVQNFKVSEERKIVTEIDKLKRSKKTLVQYFAQKKEVDEIRDSQRRMRGEREHFFQAVTGLKNKEDNIKKANMEKKATADILKKEIDEMYERKRRLFAEYKQAEADYQKMKSDIRSRQRKESVKKREEVRKAKEEAIQKEIMEYEARKEPFEDEKNLCNTLISYLLPYSASMEPLASPREETVTEQPSVAAPGPADSLDDGMFVLLKKSDDSEFISNKRANRRSRKGRKISTTKQLSHTPQIISQFASLNLAVPSNIAEVPASLEQLQARKRYYEEHSPGVANPSLGLLRLSGSFSSSGSQSSLESPLRERSSTWGFVEVPPAIAETQAPSDAGESGFHDMSRQASKTESSESAPDAQLNDQALEELIQQSSTECGESEHSRSSSDTITPEDYSPETSASASGHRRENEQTDQASERSTGDSGQSDLDSSQQGRNDSDLSICDNTADPEPIVFDDAAAEPRGGNSAGQTMLKADNSADREMPVEDDSNKQKRDKPTQSLTFPSMQPSSNSNISKIEPADHQTDMTIIVTDCSQTASNDFSEIDTENVTDTPTVRQRTCDTDNIRQCDRDLGLPLNLESEAINDVGYVSESATDSSPITVNSVPDGNSDSS